ncbi:methyltransferase [Stigmatella erecta]|uniref:Dimerisation domain-containing protein n=1 Tax=Stigmatella erecta TaxID=83460 RepID=A0A1I0L3F8_9BACT|nr:methyltransferase [Stigmatella erecta]SEU33967.1 Dimerisation domain-containing protein [Stigmatella erecta]
MSQSTNDAPAQQVSPAQQMYELVASYWKTQLVAAVARLGLADLLGRGARLSDELAHEVKASPDGVYRLLRGGVAIGLFEETPPRTFTLTPLGACLRTSEPGSMADWAITQAGQVHWLPWGQLHEAVRTGQPMTRQVLGAEGWEYLAKHPEEAASFARAMGNLSAFVASDVARVHDFSRYARVADVGGSEGVLLAAVLRAFPPCQGILFDLPHVIEGARERLKAEGLAGRTQVVGGNFFEPVLPEAEAYLLKNVLHDWDDARCTLLLTQIHRAAPAGARLLVVEGVIPDDGRASATALMDVNMLVMVGGRERTASEYKALLASASWELERITPAGALVSVVEARRR